MAPGDERHHPLCGRRDNLKPHSIGELAMATDTLVVTPAANLQNEMQRAAEHRAQRRFDEAETAYRSALELRPNHLPAMLGLGGCARERGDRAAALQQFQAAAAVQPEHPQPLLDMAAEFRAQE